MAGVLRVFSLAAGLVSRAVFGLIPGAAFSFLPWRSRRRSAPGPGPDGDSDPQLCGSPGGVPDAGSSPPERGGAGARRSVPVPYADLDDPQTLNQYGYVRNLPTVRVDADGHDTYFSSDKAEEEFSQRMDKVDAFVVRALNHPAVQAFIEVLGFRAGGAAGEGAAAGAARGVEEGISGAAAKG